MGHAQSTQIDPRLGYREHLAGLDPEQFQEQLGNPMGQGF